MKKILLIVLIAYGCSAGAQENGWASVQELERIEKVLSADDMRGRRAGTPDIDKAANFIAAEFGKAGLQPFAGTSFLQSFQMIAPRFRSVKAEMDDQEIDAKHVIVVTTEPEIKINEKSGYAFETIKAGENFAGKARGFVRSGKNLVVWVDTSFSKNFSRLTSLKGQLFPMKNSVVFVLGNYAPKEFTIKAEHKLEYTSYANVVGMIPGKSKKNEYVIFSAHHDHVGIGKPVNGDSIYNGANDDAAGTTAVIMLAKYFKQKADNERTLLFVTFTAEEIGGFGSQHFSAQLDPATVAAMVNIEMIGTESKWGKRSAFITGYEMTDMGAILQKNLSGTSFQFHPDPYPDQQLFYRSDNATLARLGVPAHTVSTAKMEAEPHYHKPSDEVATLDLENMAAIIEAIAISSSSLVAGKDTPSRVKAIDLR